MKNAGGQPDAEAIGLKVGLEIHQQLATPTKLFCACPVVKSEELPYQFSRRLRTAQSEVGRVDEAAAFEFARARSNVYRWNPESSCLVDADEEPPHPASEAAVETVLVISRLLKAAVVDEIHMMRKIVIDGSNTTGFQRTGVVALGGALEAGGLSVGVQSITVEEDACRILGQDEGARYFALDRLGVPLVEIALAPVSGPAEKSAAVALELGRLLRSTGRVARGLGTIRQDLNVSILGGRVVEVKGVQKLALLPKVIQYEAARQAGLLEIAKEIQKRKAAPVKCTTADVSKAMAKTASRPVRKQLQEGGKAVCITARGVAGLLGREPFPGVRLGKELAEVARTSSLGGVIHSDEFGKQGIAAEEAAVRKAAGAGEGDALVLVAGPVDRVDAAVPLIVARLEQAAEGVPAETRAATEEGETRFLRPRPGAQRMYPETDIPEVVIGPRDLKRVDSLLPEPWSKRVARYMKEYSLSGEMALKVYDSPAAPLFEEVCSSSGLEPSVVATVLVELPVRMAREGVPEEALTESVLRELLKAVAEGRLAKEAAPDVLRKVGRGEAKGVSDAIQVLGLGALSEEELSRVIDSAVAAAGPLPDDPERAFSALMGEVMKRARGRADGQLVSRLLRARLARDRKSG